MIDTEVKKWDRVFELTLPLLGVSIGSLSLALGVYTLSRSSPVGQRGYYLDDQYLVSVRYPGQRHGLREFVQPDNPDVIDIYSGIGPDPWALYDFVCRNISYKSDWGEYWQFPSETLKRGYGDCEDTSILLASLLRNFTNAHVTLGEYQGYGHAWVVHGGELLETTYTDARPVPDTMNYRPYAIFDDRDIIELWPGALGEVFEVGRDEAAKLNLMALEINHA